MKNMKRSNFCMLTFLLSRSAITSAFAPTRARLCDQFSNNHRRGLSAKPKRGAIVDTYKTVSVNCATCGLRLFRYKKKNGTKSNLVKCYVERIVEDCENVLLAEPNAPNKDDNGDAGNENNNIPTEYSCPSCHTRFARSATIKGLPALKLAGGKTRMTKK